MHGQTEKVRTQVEALGFSSADFRVKTFYKHGRLLTEVIFEDGPAIEAEKRYKDFYENGAIDVRFDYRRGLRPKPTRVTVSYADSTKLTIELDIAPFDVWEKLKNCGLEQDQDTMLDVIEHAQEAAQLAALPAIQHRIDQIRAERGQKP